MSSTHRERILEALRLSRHPVDDDELARRTGISPRQAVNHSCRALEEVGELRRVPGPDGKIVNVLTRRDPPAPPGPDSAGEVGGTSLPAISDDVIIVEPATMPPGSSGEQRAAEQVMLDLLGDRLGLKLDPARITVPSGARVEIDGADENRTVLVECWAHQGAPKSAQRHKVLSDALKLTWIASTIYPRPRLVLCLSDPLAAAPFQPSAMSWSAQAILDLGIKIELVELPPDVRTGILAAQERQYR
jgi:hypothetical protein